MTGASSSPGRTVAGSTPSTRTSAARRTSSTARGRPRTASAPTASTRHPHRLGRRRPRRQVRDRPVGGSATDPRHRPGVAPRLARRAPDVPGRARRVSWRGRLHRPRTPQCHFRARRRRGVGLRAVGLPVADRCMFAQTTRGYEGGAHDRRRRHGGGGEPAQDQDRRHAGCGVARRGRAQAAPRRRHGRGPHQPRHGSTAEHAASIAAVRRAAAGGDTPLAVIIDLPGPKFRLGDLPATARGARRRLIAFGRPPARPATGELSRAPAALRRGERVLIDGGAVALRVSASTPHGHPGSPERRHHRVAQGRQPARHAPADQHPHPRRPRAARLGRAARRRLRGAVVRARRRRRASSSRS